MTEEDAFSFKDLYVEDAGMGHGYAIIEGWHYYDTKKEASEQIAEWVAMEKIYNELKKAFIEHDEYPPLTKWFKETVVVERKE